MAETPDPLADEIKRFAEALAATEDEDVLDSAALLVREHRASVQMIHSLDGVDRMLQEDVVAIERRLQDRLRKAKEQLRDSLKKLLAWAKESRRM